MSGVRTRAPQRGGAEFLAPAFRLAGGDTLVVVGTREGADAAAELLTQEE